MTTYTLRNQTLAILLGLLLGGRLSGAETGYIYQTNYRLGSDGKREEVDQGAKIWFTPKATRRETWENGELTTIQVSGSQTWTAYPRIGRLARHASGGVPFHNFAEETRNSGTRFRTKQRLGSDELLGFPCEKFQWHEPGRLTGDIRMPPSDNTVWVCQDEHFPLVLRWESSLGLSTDSKELRLDCEVPESRFKEPENLRPIIPFKLPSTNFSMRLLKTRASLEYGWRVQTTYEIRGDALAAICVTRTINSDTNGKEMVRTNEIKLSADQLSLTLNELRQPYWWGVERKGGRNWQGLEADVYAPDAARRSLDEEYWVVDHPVLGTITVMKKIRSPQEETVALVEFELGSNHLEPRRIEDSAPNAAPPRR